MTGRKEFKVREQILILISSLTKQRGANGQAEKSGNGGGGERTFTSAFCLQPTAYYSFGHYVQRKMRGIPAL